MFVGDSEFEVAIGTAVRLPMPLEPCGRLAARMGSEYRVHNRREKNMVCIQF